MFITDGGSREHGSWNFQHAGPWIMNLSALLTIELGHWLGTLSECNCDFIDLDTHHFITDYP